MKKLNWQKIWKDFDAWIEAEEEVVGCGECGALGDTPEWERQMEMIQTLVNRQLEGK